MVDDLSAVPRNGCAVYYGDKHIRHYNGNTYSDFYLIGDKYVHTYTRTQSTPANHDGYVCLNLENLRSYNVVNEPIFVFISLILAILVGYLVAKIIGIFVKWRF